MEHTYWRHPTLPGIKVEEVTGDTGTKPNVWLEMAYQIYCENGKEAYRELGHFRNGAPFLYGETSRISITHCKGFLAVATLPSTPEVELGEFTPRAAMGIDAEALDREQVLKIRERFLSAGELEMIAADDLQRNLQAWTMKEAAYKAAMTEGLDFREAIFIDRIPPIGPDTTHYDRKEFDPHGDGTGFHAEDYGEMHVCFPDGTEQRFLAYSYISEGHMVTLVFSPQCAKFEKSDSKNS
jgi:hypothetical protein